MTSLQAIPKYFTKLLFVNLTFSLQLFCFQVYSGLKVILRTLFNSITFSLLLLKHFKSVLQNRFCRQVEKCWKFLVILYLLRRNVSKVPILLEIMTTTRKYEEIEFGFIEKIDSEGFHKKVTEMILTDVRTWYKVHWNIWTRKCFCQLLSTTIQSKSSFHQIFY